MTAAALGRHTGRVGKGTRGQAQREQRGEPDRRARKAAASETGPSPVRHRNASAEPKLQAYQGEVLQTYRNYAFIAASVLPLPSRVAGAAASAVAAVMIVFRTASFWDPAASMYA